MSLPPEPVLAAWQLEGVVPVPVHSGLINPTWLLRHDDVPVGVLQRLNTTIFHPRVHEDIEAVTAHLAAKGCLTPRLQRTDEGALFHAHGDDVYRLLSYVGDRTVDTLTDPADATSAGACVGRVHAALEDFDHAYVHVRPGAHDTDAHAATLRAALDAHFDHRLHGAVAALADDLLTQWSALRDRLPKLPPCHVHGDLKISNIRFQGPDAVALIDLDTFAIGDLGVEMGDAMRSWCATAPESSTQVAFDLDLFEAALRGYVQGRGDRPPPEAFWSAIVPSTIRICTELAMRFAADALNESYFGWNAAQYPTAGDHNLVRAQGQANLAQAVSLVQREAERRAWAAATSS